MSSKQITKQLIEDIAISMVYPLEQQIKLISDKLSDYCEAEYNQTIPKELLSLSLNSQKYLKTTNRIVLEGNGLNFENIKLRDKRTVLFTSDYSSYNTLFIPLPQQAVIIVSLVNQKKDLENQRSGLIIDISVTLSSLKTYNRIKEAFPEAYALIPEAKENISLALPIENLRKKLHSLKKV